MHVKCKGISFDTWIDAGYSLTWIIWPLLSTAELVVIIWSFLSIEGLAALAFYIINIQMNLFLTAYMLPTGIWFAGIGVASNEKFDGDNVWKLIV